ncbi:hypothetical protein [Gimesia aquarii]|uniref:Uncharacterized protein n=1 Tax=Gimesia aquarii TaxID=2527964 RepID=A0A517WNL9_9PLAN|nr:hypothetical protein [Gimesia aquarii]QDU06833.1 hypothetical protein V202x_01760 [Gimesia aquarii]
MIRPIAPTHQEAADKVERIKQTEQILKANRKHTTTEIIVYGIVCLLLISGCFLVGRLITWLIQHI